MNYEQLGLLGIFIAGAIPWFEAIAVIPSGIIFGLDPILTVIAAVSGNAITIFVFAYAGSQIRQWLISRREAKGKVGESKRFAKAQAAFDKYGIYGMALLGPILIGTQFAAAISVAAGVKPFKSASLVTAGMVIWSVLIAWVLVAIGVDQWLEIQNSN
ncbi:MAG: hypothetical protein F2536_02670 [Actinobacteria bacterium]|uniref:Unannotated protein n=1 Tax=freshwater metagenome TaxID=449393 RepID=A0A6J6DSX8_9ZZZZ|nr:hypothetical protein [Actinomycetota bacterium]MTA89813.1 hypothetical protein [Actinomycetota bacterium]